MEKLNVIPYPLKAIPTGGAVSLEGVDIDSIKADISGKLGREEYVLKMSRSGVKITAGSDRGEFYAKQTLLQLARSAAVPCAVIEDRPRFSYRGFMVDTARHIVSIEETKKLIDAAASVKMNIMHWHLSDDQGWRIELDSHPEITRKASVRQGSHFGNKNHNEYEYGGYFTKAQLREVVEYAAQRYITVIPEIDMPGHMRALLHARPDLSCTGKELPVETRQGIYPDILCAGKEKTFEVMFDILGELLEIFPSEYIHIGGDEAPKKRWSACPDCRKRMEENSLRNEEELQGWFVNRIIDFLKKNGRKAIVWNESLKSGLVRDAAVQNWMDKNGACAAFAASGGKVIISDFFHYYVDYPYSMTPLKKTYEYDPCTGVKAAARTNILGVEAPVWLEYIDNFSSLCYQCFPRMTAVAETGWSSPSVRNEADFERRFLLYAGYLGQIGITPADKREWNPSLVARGVKTLKFFRNTFNPAAVKGFE